MKLLPYISFEKCIYILALEMASPGNRNCANCIFCVSRAACQQQMDVINACRYSPVYCPHCLQRHCHVRSFREIINERAQALVTYCRHTQNLLLLLQPSMHYQLHVVL